MTVRTSTPKTYILPSVSEMREAADSLKLKKFSPSLVEDLCNIQVGGEFHSISEVERELRYDPTIEKNLNLGFDGDFKFRGSYIKTENGEYIQSKNTAINIASKKEINYHLKVQEFLRSLDLKNVPGNSPLEKAMGILKLLSLKKGGNPQDMDGETLPIFFDSKEAPQKVGESINETLETIDSLDEIEKNLLNVEGKSTLEIAEDMVSGKEIMLKIKRQLDQLVKLKTSKSSKLTPDTEGDKTRYRGIKELSEIDRLNPSEFIYPKRYQMYRLVTGEAQIREKCIVEEKKMLLYLICDCSGSMSGDRFWKAGGVLMNRLKAVLKGEAELVFSFFDESLHQEFLVTSKEEAKKVMQKIKKDNFRGGGTSIATATVTALERINKRLEESPHLTKPELLIVTDGDDDTDSLTLEHLGRIRLHTLMVGGSNEHLLNLASRSGGVALSNL